MNLLVLALIMVLCVDGSLGSLYGSANEREGVSSVDKSTIRVDTTEKTEKNPIEVEDGTTTEPSALSFEIVESSEALMSLRKLRQDLAARLASIDDDSSTAPDMGEDERVQATLTSSQALSKSKQIEQDLSAEITETEIYKDDEQSVSSTMHLTSPVEKDNVSESTSQNSRKQSDESVKGLPLIRSKSVTLPRAMKVPTAHNSDEEISVEPKNSTPTLKPSESFRILPSLFDLGVPAGFKILRVPSRRGSTQGCDNEDEELDKGKMSTSNTAYKPKIDPSLFKEPSKQEQSHHIKRNTLPRTNTTNHRGQPANLHGTKYASQ